METVRGLMGAKPAGAAPSNTLVKIDQSSRRGLGHSFWAMKKVLSLKQVLAVPCPTCGAKPGEKCELSAGQPRTDPHRDRRLIAKDQT
jgi:hypothetical protein